MNPKWLTALVCEYPVSENQLPRDATLIVTKKENSHKSGHIHLSEQKRGDSHIEHLGHRAKCTTKPQILNNPERETENLINGKCTCVQRVNSNPNRVFKMYA